MKNIVIFSHQGLGDLILCNAIVRNYAKNYDTVYVLAKDHNYYNTSYMYRDNKKIEVIQIEWNYVKNIYNDDLIFEKYLNNKGLIYEKILKIGYCDFQFTFDSMFYEHAEIDIDKKWTDFYYERNIEREKDVYYNILRLNDDEKFIFVHDDHLRNFKINENFIKNDYRIIRPDNLSLKVFDFLYTIERAQEVHCMNSSIICLIDIMLLRNDNLYYHKYVRGYNTDPLLKLNWIIL